MPNYTTWSISGIII